MTGYGNRLATLKSVSSGILDQGVLRPHESIEAVWTHIVGGLEALATNGKADQVSLSENALTQRLIDELEGQGGYRPYFFQKEYMEDDDDGHSPRADIAVLGREKNTVLVNGVSYGAKAKFLVIEAKRLPTPEKRRLREYVIGGSDEKKSNTGGIERFKRGDHGRALNEIGMIGYVQRHSFNYWHAEINRWLDELIANSQHDLSWDIQDRLHFEVNGARLARLESHSLRKTDNRRLVIRHLWVRLTQTAADLGSS